MTSVFGTWRLVRAVARDATGTELPTPYGGYPSGRVMLGADGRMMAVTCDGRREIPRRRRPRIQQLLPAPTRSTASSS